MNSNKTSDKPQQNPTSFEQTKQPNKPVAGAVGMAGAAIAAGKDARAKDNPSRPNDSTEKVRTERNQNTKTSA